MPQARRWTVISVNDMMRNKAKLVINICYIIVLLLIAAIACSAFVELQREAEEISQTPGFSGSDLLGTAVAYGALAIVFYTAFISVTDIYFCLRYYLFSDRKSWKNTVNGISLFLSAISLLLLFLFGVQIDETHLSPGFLWAMAYPLFRLVYGTVSLRKD